MLSFILENKEKKRKNGIFLTPFFTPCAKLLCISLVLSDDLLTLVITASLAHTVCKNGLAALRALYNVGGGFKLPNAGASLHLS